MLVSYSYKKTTINICSSDDLILKRQYKNKYIILYDNNIPPIILSYIKYIDNNQRCRGIDYRYFVNTKSSINGFKDIDTIIKILMKCNISKDDIIIAVGGGSLLDVVGFVASIYLRGVQWIAIPTTLLSMVDSAIGGKTAINIGNIKNIIGSFHLPKQVFCCIDILLELDWEIFRDGISEIIKMGFIYNRMLLTLLKDRKKIYNRNYDCIKNLVVQSIQSKLDVIKNDLFDNKDRVMLNYGHTFAHAIEANDSKITHGQAVAIGLIYEAKLAVKINNLSSDILQIHKDIIKEYDLPINYHNIINALQYIRYDKKRKDDLINFVLLSDINKWNIVAINYNNLNSILC